MNIAIAHYHLRPGGVTRVIENTCAALEGRADIVTRVVAEGFDYCTGSDAPSGRALARTLRAAAPDADLWHVHNPTLGKHRTLPDALASLFADGVSLLLQIHDFAEDNRPANLLVTAGAETPYPPAHYATVNTRDRAILIAAGLDPARAHFLPNPVAIDPDPPPLPNNDRRLVFYPVRGIRRKNLGEVALLAAVAPDARFAIASAPENPTWRPYFEDWRRFCAELALPVEFDVVHSDVAGKTIDDWYAAADVIVTTSVAEGFGLAFLESFAKGRPLLGRDLPDITKDFRANGLQFGGLYSALRLAGDGTDFAALDEVEQRELIRSFCSDPTRAVDIEVETRRGNFPLPDWLEAHLPGNASEITSNREAIAEHYSLARYAERLINVYSKVLSDRPARVEIDRRKILEAFQPPATANIELLRELSAPLEPEPTDVTPRLEPLAGIRAVLFDIYGTLFVSAAGDSPPADLADEIARSHERSRAAGEPFPEVDIRGIWRSVLGKEQRSDAAIETHAIDFECRANPVWPMPHAAETLIRLRAAGSALGIISNAQFMTPLLFDALLGSDLDSMGFARSLCFWSYREGCAKPSPKLFARAARALDAGGISPAETLFVGNDMRKDITPARDVGFRTALFAGCARSLRPSPDSPEAKSTYLSQLRQISVSPERALGVPDLIITDLAQLPAAIGH